jgi:hypothetical protein
MGKFREVGADGLGAFTARGHRARSFFPHRAYFLRKAGPDALKLSGRMCGLREPESLWEVVLTAISPQVDEFPPDLFFDDDVVWHQQQLGIPGQVAFAYLAVGGDTMYGLNYVSDVVQRISRRREFKTRIEKVFQGWADMLLNSVLSLGQELGVRTFYSPTAELALCNTDRTRRVERELFNRVYDRTLTRLYAAEPQGSWWRINLEANRDRVVVPESRLAAEPAGRTLCLCHDTERGRGHLDADPRFADEAERTSPASLREMLRIEAAFGLRATYNVVGELLAEVGGSIRNAGHCLAFHSFDHRVDAGRGVSHQLRRCRSADYRLKGYRAPQSKITAELDDYNLCFYNFDWFASSVPSLGFAAPRLENRVVKLPIRFDDYALYTGQQELEGWIRGAVTAVERSEFCAFSLHDCYAPFWLARYPALLDALLPLGRFVTGDQLAAEVFLRDAV